MKRRLILILAVLVFAILCGPPLTRATDYGAYNNTVLAALGDHLIALWPLNETSGTTAYDIKNSCNGTHTGDTLNQLDGDGASFGKAALFDGINDYVDIYSTCLANKFSTSTGFMSIWVNLDSTATGYGTAIEIGNSSTNRLGINHATTELARKMQGFWTNSKIIQGGDTVLPAANTWYHQLLTWDKPNDSLKLYRNGVAVGTPVATLPAWSGGITHAGVGWMPDLSGYYWKGYLQQVAVGDIVPDATQRAALTTPNPPPTPTPTAMPHPPELIATLQNGNQWELDYRITAGDIAQFMPALILISFLIVLLIFKLVRR